jgi:hypothetical protein
MIICLRPTKGFSKFWNFFSFGHFNKHLVGST